jgi:hypothetical protein
MESQANGAPAPEDTSRPGDLMASTLRAYRNRLGRDRRRAFVGVSGIGIGVMWIGMSLLYAVDMASPLILAVAASLTLTVPFLALLAEIITRPSLRTTARILDSRLDDRQRLVTALELGGKAELGPLDATQVATSARLLSRADPKVVSPIRSMRPSLALTAGLLCLSLAVFVLKGTGGQFVPYRTGTLPQTPEELAQLATPTAVTGLPDAEQQATQQAGSPNATPGADGQNSLTPAQQEAAESQDAKSSLDTLGKSLDGQGATQSIADNLRNGNYDEAAKQLGELGQQNDQLSEQAKKDLADALDAASDDPNTTDDMRFKERQAANALRKGKYKDIDEALGNLGKSVQDTAGKVMTQEEMAQAFPSPTAGTGGAGQVPPAAPSQNGEQSAQDGQQGTQPGEQNQGGQSQQSGENQQGGGQQQGQGEQSQQSGGQNGQGKQSGEQGQGEAGQGQGQQGQSQSGGQAQNEQPGQGNPGAGDGHRETGPTGPGSVNGGASNPFELEGSKDPKGGNPSDGNQPALSVEGDRQQSSQAAPADQGTASNVPGENSRVPVERWDVVQRYFNGQ